MLIKTNRSVSECAKSKNLFIYVQSSVIITPTI